MMRRHLSPPMMVSLIALFAGLGGGYAAAFSGSGSLKKASVTPVSASNTDLRSLKGFGILKHRCVAGVVIALDNTTRHRIDVSVFKEHDGDYDFVQLDPGELQDIATLASGAPRKSVRLHLSRQGTSDKAQVDAVISGVKGSAGAPCFATKVLALNTQDETRGAAWRLVTSSDRSRALSALSR